MKVVLSRRNLLTLLSKLDRVRAGDTSACTIIKPNGTKIKAEEDDVHYAGRVPGEMHPADDPGVAA